MRLGRQPQGMPLLLLLRHGEEQPQFCSTVGGLCPCFLASLEYRCLYIVHIVEAFHLLLDRLSVDFLTHGHACWPPLTPFRSADCAQAWAAQRRLLESESDTAATRGLLRPGVEKQTHLRTSSEPGCFRCEGGWSFRCRSPLPVPMIDLDVSAGCEATTVAASVQTRAGLLRRKVFSRSCSKQ